MPYEPSQKTDGISLDRVLIDKKVESLAEAIVTDIRENSDVLIIYKNVFRDIGKVLQAFNTGKPLVNTASSDALALASVVFEVGAKYNYWGAFLGELNYAITRLIQVVPQKMVNHNLWSTKDELRYWLYACTVQALTYTVAYFSENNSGIGGVFEDIKDEYKVRVNIGYEMAQIEMSGDCYDTPYYNRIVELLDETGKCVGKIYANMARSSSTLHIDKLPFAVPVRTLVHTAKE